MTLPVKSVPLSNNTVLSSPWRLSNCAILRLLPFGA